MNLRSIRTLLAALALALCTNPGWSQSDLTRVDGRITKAGKSLVGVRVILSNQDTFEAYHATTDKYGTFSIPEVARGMYIVSIMSAADDKLYRETLQLTSAPDAPIRLDLDIAGAPVGPPTSSPQASTRPTATSAPQDAKNAELDSFIRQYDSALRTGDHQAEIAALKAIVAADPTRWDYFDALGSVQMTVGDYDHAVESFDNGIQAAQRLLSSASSNDSTILKSDRDRARAGIVQMLISQGNSYMTLKKNNEAIAAYTKAAELAPDPSIAYFNLCVLHYNTGNRDGALDACGKAIASNPNKTDAYFIKGSLLFAAAKTNKDGSLTVAAGTVEALKKYLELAPTGAHAKDVKQMLEYISAHAGSSGNSGKKP